MLAHEGGMRALWGGGQEDGLEGWLVNMPGGPGDISGLGMDVDCLQDHFHTCPGLSGTCPHCSLDFTKDQLGTHVASCPEELVQCSSSNYGCPFVCPRRELSDHHPECAFTLLAPTLSSHESQIASLQLENKLLRRKLDILIPTRSLPPSNSTESPSIIDEQTYHILSEQEHIRDDISRLSGTLAASEMKQSMALMNETIRLKEELAAARSAIAGLRMQMHWLMSSRMHGVPGIAGQPQPHPQPPQTQGREEREGSENRARPMPVPPRQEERPNPRRLSGELSSPIESFGVLLTSCRECCKVIDLSHNNNDSPFLRRSSCLL